MKKIIALAVCVLMLCATGIPAFAMTPQEFEDEGYRYLNSGSEFAAATNFFQAGAGYMGLENYKKAESLIQQAKELFLAYGYSDSMVGLCDEYLDEVQKKMNNSSGTTLSEGSLTVIVGIAAAVVFGLGGLLLGRKSRKTAD